ncbi:MAG: serine/threonine protein kinase [Phycisphaerae bacterium]|nr:serine/threonine protein kinase [Phycisphaerae bacterium]
MALPIERDPSAGVEDPLDHALEAIRHGDGSQLDLLLESEEPGGPRLGELFQDLFSSQTRLFVGLESQSRVADYQICREIGRGGMGVVYEAEQLEPRRRVALKVLPGLYADEFHLKLFRREIQILARLKHAAIATIYEAGQTPEGQHFFTMELARGVPLNEYVREREMPLPERLTLFLKIGQAVNYAHQHGVIHCDLKPSNIIIDADGNPKILDFGLARLTDADVVITTVISETGKIMGTLPYMSPEQTRGNPAEIDLRSDTYSLGVVLYELLTERLPYDLNRAAVPEAIRIICEETPRRPSIFRRALLGDLETITLKALEKEPSRRYQSALALTEDLERYLTHQPILARPPRTMYQFRKLVARHKVVFVSLAFVLAALLVFIATMRIQLSATARQRDLAVTAEQDKDQIMAFILDDMLAAANPSQAHGSNVTVRQVLDEASLRLKSRFADQPQIEAAFRETIGSSYRSLELYDDAEPHLRAALALRKQFATDEPARFATALRSLAHLLRDMGDCAEAEPLYLQALSIRRELWGDNHPDIAESLTDLANLKYSEREYKKAESLFRQALELRRSLPGDQRCDVADSLFDLAQLQHTIYQYQAARSSYNQALAIYRQVGDQPLREADIMNCLANLFRPMVDLAAAEQMHRDVLKLRRLHLGDKHLDVSESLMNLAVVLREMRTYEEVEGLYLEALEIYRDLLGGEHRDVGGALIGLGSSLSERGRPEIGEPRLREGLAIWRKTPPQENWLYAEAESLLGECLTHLERYEEAQPLVLRGYLAVKEAKGEQHRRTGMALDRIIQLYEAWERPDQAAEYRALRPPAKFLEQPSP